MSPLTLLEFLSKLNTIGEDAEIRFRANARAGRLEMLTELTIGGGRFRSLVHVQDHEIACFGMEVLSDYFTAVLSKMEHEKSLCQ
jgi:hypothetical protein